MKTIVFSILCLICVNLGFSQNLKADIDPLMDLKLRAPIKDLKVGDSLPNWGVIHIDKAEKTMLKEMYKKQLLLIEFWFIPCKYCVESIPKLNQLLTEYNGQGLKIVYANASIYNGKEIIDEYRNKHKILFDVYRFGNIFEYGSLPTFMFVDRNGIIQYKVDGYPDDLIRDVNKLMQKYN
jgi:thiol-disulfide isomerase/thioredoxin